MGGFDTFDTGAFLSLLPWTAAGVAVLLGVTFAVALAVGRHSDVAWGLGFVVVAGTALVVALVTDAPGDPLRRGVVAALVGLWGLRPAAHIHLRSRGEGEDPRYAELLDERPGHPRLQALRRIYLPQAAILWFVSLPVQVAMVQDSGLGWVAWAGVLLWGVGMFFETVGDWQLTRFRNDPDTGGQVLDTGLWRYTRHPNYFGDACVWWGLSLVAFSAWPGILTVLSPVLMTWLLARGTGKPLLEKDIAERRPGYAAYVRRTSGFVPLPPKGKHA